MQRDEVNIDNLCERVSEAIFLELIGETDSHFEIAQQVAKYLDSEHKIEKSISIEVTVPISLPPGTENGHCQSIIEQVQRTLADSFGGFTKINATGGWYDENEELVEEPSRIIISSLSIGEWIHVTETLKSIILDIQNSLKQRCVYVSIHTINQIVNLLGDMAEFPSQETFLGIDQAVTEAENYTPPREPQKMTYEGEISEPNSAEIEKLKSEMNELKETVQELQSKDEQITDPEPIQRIHLLLEDAIDIGANVLAMTADELVGLGDLAYKIGKTTTAELYYFHAKDKCLIDGNQIGYADILIDLARVCHRRGMYSRQQALIEEALPIFTDNDYQGQALSALFQLGDSLAMRNDNQRAYVVYTMLFKMAIDAEDYLISADALVRLGNITENYDERLQHYFAAIELYEKFSEPNMSMAGCLLNIGFALQGTGQYEESRKNLSRAKEIGGKISPDDLEFQYQVMEKFAMLEKSAGDYRKALDYSKQCLEIAGKMEAPLYECVSLTTLTQISLQLENIEEAIGYNANLKEINKENDFPRSNIEYLHNEGNICIEKGEHEAAISWFEKALVLCYEHNYEYDAMWLEFDIAESQTKVSSDGEIIMNHIKQGISLSEKLSHFDGFARGTTLLATISDAFGDYDMSFNLYKKLLDQLEGRGGDKHAIMVTLNNMGVNRLDNKMPYESLEYFTKAEAIAQELGYFKHLWSLVLGNIGRAYAKLGEKENSKHYFEVGLKIAIENQFDDVIANIKKELGNL